MKSFVHLTSEELIRWCENSKELTPLEIALYQKLNAANDQIRETEVLLEQLVDLKEKLDERL